MQDIPVLLSPGSHHPNFTSGDPEGLKCLSYGIRLRLPSLPRLRSPGFACWAAPLPPAGTEVGLANGSVARQRALRGLGVRLPAFWSPCCLRPLNPGGASYPDGHTILNEAVGGWAEYPHLQQPVWETRERTFQVIPGRRTRRPPWGVGSDPTVTQLRVSGQASLSHHI